MAHLGAKTMQFSPHFCQTPSNVLLHSHARHHVISPSANTEWVLDQGEDQRLLHVTECSRGEEAAKEKQAAAMEDEHVSDELAFLVASSFQLAPAAAESMPYIM